MKAYVRRCGETLLFLTKLSALSHFHERKEKNCLNCGTEVAGKFCQSCGQENIEPHQSFWQLLKHYFEDLTHFDGKFFSSTWNLVSRPGFLPVEYIKGKRASHLNPIRMYIFSSALFFFVFFSGRNKEDIMKIQPNGTQVSPDAVMEMDSTKFADYTKELNRSIGRQELPMSREAYQRFIDSTTGAGIFSGTIKYHSRAELDSAIASGRERDISWLEKKFRYREIDLGNKYGHNTQSLEKVIRDKFLHSLPQLIFISLPFTALFLLMLYYRQRQFFYADHFIFSLHLYIFLFIVLLFDILLKKLDANAGVTFFSWLSRGLWFWFWLYALLALKRFYQRGWWASILRFLLLLLLIGFILLLIFGVSAILFYLFFV